MKKKSTDNFSKFAKKQSNAAIKEKYKQEKRKYNKEKQAFFAKKKAEEKFGKTVVDKNQTVPTPTTNAAVQKRKITNEKMPLNKFLAHAGICGRREAAAFVKQGQVKVNGNLVTEPGYKVNHNDEIKYNGKKIFLTKNLVYILLNKPKDYITTTADPQGRKTVLSLIQRATKERVYPVGRLDRNTSGVLLFTNDGELAQKLTHPSHEIKKVYQVTLDKALTKADFEKILFGIQLEDGLIKADALAYSDARDKKQIGIEIHSGRNRIVRRIFESLGYTVKNLDRVIFAGLTKKNIERGKWRFLQEKEIRDLKHFTKGK
ncbi:MAG: pseudouridine synthase [Chitinophagaceae bacterium]|nr:pseudouridine synthase [Chitinophagaceae bacterium]